MISFSLYSIYSIYLKTGTHHFWKSNFSCASLLSVTVPVRKRTLSSSVAWALSDNDKNSSQGTPLMAELLLCAEPAAGLPGTWHSPSRPGWGERSGTWAAAMGWSHRSSGDPSMPLSCCRAKGRVCRQAELPPAVTPAALSTAHWAGPVCAHGPRNCLTRTAQQTLGCGRQFCSLTLCVEGNTSPSSLCMPLIPLFLGTASCSLLQWHLNILSLNPAVILKIIPSSTPTLFLKSNNSHSLYETCSESLITSFPFLLYHIQAIERTITE